MIAPGDQFAGGIEATLEEMEPGGAIVIVVKIVLAGPEEFDGDAYMLSNSTGFQHVVIGEPTAESAAGALQVDDDVVVGNIENFGDQRSEEHTSELQSLTNLVCRLLLEKKKQNMKEK